MMKNKWVALLFQLIAIFGCVSNSSSTLLPNPNTELERDNSPIGRIDDYLQENSKETATFQPLLKVLKAEQHVKAGRFGAALIAYENLIKSDGVISQWALLGLIDTYRKLVADQNPEVIAKMIWVRTSEGKDNGYIRHLGIASLPKMVRFIEKQSFGVEKTEWPNESEDPLFEKRALVICENESSQKESLMRGMHESVQKYFAALLAECEHSDEQAIVMFTRSVPMLFRGTNRQDLAINGQLRKIKLERKLGLRKQAAKSYKYLALLLAKVDWRLMSRGFTTKSEFRAFYANQLIWAGRYTALVGEYNVAKKFIADAFSILRTGVEVGSNKRLRREFVELRAEAHHVLAYRVEVENRNYSGAIVLARLALAIPELPKTWVDRFQWLTGIYMFAAENYTGACEHWQKIKEDLSASYQAKSLFWLHRCYSNLGKADQAQRALDGLLTEFPLSFYSTYGADKLGIDNPLFQMNVQNNQDLLQEMEGRALDTSALNDAGFGPDVQYIRVLAHLNLMSSAKRLARDLYRWVRREKRDIAIESQLYLSRLLNLVGATFYGILQSKRVVGSDEFSWQDYPEQLLVLFPFPRRSVFFQACPSEGIPVASLLSIAHQESHFRADARSPVGALGLMQLMPKTARRYAKGESIELEDLLNPATNLRISCRYLRSLQQRYSNRWTEIAAAYNAGEKVVNIWKMKRQHDDEMLWVEFIPFGETQHYVKNVLRNKFVYRLLY